MGKGRRRHRRYVEECWGVLRTEEAYCMLERGASPPTLVVAALRGRPAPVAVALEFRDNLLWGGWGRLYFRCPSCARRVSRLYLPTPGEDARCRRCWRLPYTTQAYTYRAGDIKTWGKSIRWVTPAWVDWTFVRGVSQSRQRFTPGTGSGSIGDLGLVSARGVGVSG